MLQVPDTLVTPSSRVADWMHNHPSAFPPKSFGLNQGFVDAMRKFDKEWHDEHDITWLFGEEIEFTLTEKNKPVQNQKNRKALIDELTEHFSEQFTADMGANAAAELEDKIEALSDFSLSELVMCKLHEVTLPDVLEYRFGTGALGDGYYDFPPVLEVRVAKQPAEQAVENYNKVVSTIQSVANEYDLSSRFYRHHLNFSANRNSDGANLTQIDDEESLDFSSKAAEGINHLIDEAFPLTEDSWANDSYDCKPRIGLDRKSRLRVCDNRLEFRGAHADDNTHLAMEMAMILGGAKYGHERTSADYHMTLYPPSRSVEGIKISNPLHPEFKATKKVLASARRSKDGRLFVPENVMELYLSYLKEEHDLQDMSDSDALVTLDSRFNKVRVNDDGALDFSLIHDADWQSLLGKMSCERTFTTVENDGYRHKGGYEHGEQNVARMDASKSLRDVFGDRLVDDAVALCGNQTRMNQIIGEQLEKYRPKLTQPMRGRIIADVAEQLARDIKVQARQFAPPLEDEIISQSAQFMNRIAAEPAKIGFKEGDRGRLRYIAHELNAIHQQEMAL